MENPDDQLRAFQEADATGGFTLVELLVVLAIMGFVAALSGPVLSKRGADRRLDMFVENLAAMVSAARSRAIAESTIVSLRFDPSHRVLESDASSSLAVPPEIAMRFTPPPGMRASSDVLRFLPDGRSSGGEIEVALDRQIRLVTVTRLTGTLDLTARVETR